MTFEDVPDFNIDDSENPLILPDSPSLAKKVEAAYDENDIDIQNFSEYEFEDFAFPAPSKTTVQKKETPPPPVQESNEVTFSTEEEIDLDNFLSGGGEDVTAQFDVPVSDFVVGGGDDITDDFLSELNSEFSGRPKKEDKNEYLFDAPVDIELTFDDSYVDGIQSESYEHVIDESEAFADITITDADGVEDNFDDFFNTPSDIPSIIETNKQETTTFDIVNEFDDFLSSDAQEAPLSEVNKSERKILKIVDYNITVKEDDVASSRTIATSDADSELDVNESIPLFTSEEERKQQIARYIKKSDSLSNIETSSSSTEDFDVDSLLAEVEDTTDITGSIVETELSADTEKEIPTLDDLDGVDRTLPEIDDMEIINDSQIPDEPSDDTIDFDIPVQEESLTDNDISNNSFSESEAGDFTLKDKTNYDFNALNDNKKLDITKNSEYNSIELDEEEPMNFEDITQTPQEDEKLNEFSDPGEVASSSDSSSVLKEISSELSQLRSELASLKAEFSAFKNSKIISEPLTEDIPVDDQIIPEETAEENVELNVEPAEEPEATPAVESGSTGFFDDNAEDDTIALSGDELSNILNSADFTEEYVDNTQEEPQNSELPGSVTEVSQEDEISFDEEPVAEESEDVGIDTDINFDEKLEEPEIDDIEISNDLDATVEDDISIPKVDDILEPPAEDDIVGEEVPVTTDSLSSDNIDYLESESVSTDESSVIPEKGGLDIPDDFEIEEETQDISLEEPEEEPVPTVESVTNDIPSDESSDDFSMPESTEDLSVDFTEQDITPEAPLDLPSEELDEEAEANEPTEKVFESEQWNEPEESPVEEPVTSSEPESEGTHSVLEKANQIHESMPADLKDEIKSVLIYMDQLLENLPEDKIEEFAKSEYFETYKKLFKELGLS